jgi:hypothetical protein
LSVILAKSEIGGLQFKASWGKKLARPYLKNNLVVMFHACNPSYLGDSTCKSMTPYLKNKVKAKGLKVLKRQSTCLARLRP